VGLASPFCIGRLLRSVFVAVVNWVLVSLDPIKCWSVWVTSHTSWHFQSALGFMMSFMLDCSSRFMGSLLWWYRTCLRCSMAGQCRSRQQCLRGALLEDSMSSWFSGRELRQRRRRGFLEEFQRLFPKFQLEDELLLQGRRDVMVGLQYRRRNKISQES